jgi:hypothetical protein
MVEAEELLLLLWRHMVLTFLTHRTKPTDDYTHVVTEIDSAMG